MRRSRGVAVRVGLDRAARRMLGIGAAALLGVVVAAAPNARGEASSTVAPQEAPSPGVEAAPTPVAPRASEIASRLEETYSELRSLHATLDEQKGIETVARELPRLRERLEALATDRDALRARARTAKSLDDLEARWREASADLTRWGESLGETAASLDRILASLGELAAGWERTEAGAAEEGLPESVVQRVRATLAQIRATEAEVRSRRARVLELQNAVSEEQVEAETMLERIAAVREEHRSRLLRYDQPPIWEMLRAPPPSPSIEEQVAESVWRDARAIADYAEGHWEPFAWQLLLLVGAGLLLSSLARQRRRSSFGDPELEAAARVLGRPWSAALLASLLASPWIHPLAPSSLGTLFVLLAIAPVLRLLPRERGGVPTATRAAVVGMTLLVLLSQQVDRTSLAHRCLLLLEAGAGLILLWRFLRPLEPGRVRMPWRLLLWLGHRALVLGLAVALFSDVLGDVLLADLLTGGLLRSALIAAVIYAAVRVLDGVVIMLPRAGALAAAEAVRKNAPTVARRGVWLTHLAGFVLWLWFALGFLHVREPAGRAFEAFLGASWRVGTIELSAGNAFVFAIAFAATIAIARATRFLLEEDVLPRFDLPRGVPGAISAGTRYTILGLGLLLSLGLAGFSLSSLALVAGGLGVGIGFGLQNVVNNFVSGLILLFERPVRDGDFVETGTTFGQVTRIGFRSSTFRTWQGSEVIVPNADLISSTVSNWTLSDNRRCLELPVRAAYGSEPRAVMDLLMRVAAEHPETLEDPPPAVYLTGFSETAIELSLRFWTPFEVGFRTRSEVAVAVEEALRRAGFAAPIPHRVVHLAREPEASA